MYKNLNLPDIWGQGAVFAYSGLEGECTYSKSICGTLMADRLGIQFRNLHKPLNRAYFIVKLTDIFNIYYKCITSDTICAEIKDNKGNIYPLDILFVNQNTIVLESRLPTCAKMVFDYDVVEKEKNSTVIYEGEGDKFALSQKISEGNIKIAVSYGENAEQVSLKALETDIEKLLESRYDFYKSLKTPEFKSESDEKLYYKAVSVLRSDVYTPEGKISYKSLTPDRFPHRAIWLWDTAYLSMGFKYISDDVAKQAVKSILQCAKKDGFIPHMTTPYWQSGITQPPLLAWTSLELYKHGKDKKFLEDVFDKLSTYIEWDLKNRDKNGNGLTEWIVGDDPYCKCDESGMDNTPRFDSAGEMDCIDFSAFIANEMRCLAEIADIIQRPYEKKLWQKRFEFIKEKINTLLWDSEDEFYYDVKLSDGKYHKVKSVASFITLFAGVCDSEKAEKMVKHLMNPKEFWTAFPVPTVSADDETYHTKDMFRGTVWLNFNYLINLGLEEYGYHKEAKALREKTVQTLKKWYLNDGVLYEFYDSKDEITPSRLSRKDIALQPYMPEIRYQSVRDFSWGACALINFLQYGGTNSFKE